MPTMAQYNHSGINTAIIRNEARAMVQNIVQQEILKVAQDQEDQRQDDQELDNTTVKFTSHPCERTDVL